MIKNTIHSFMSLDHCYCIRINTFSAKINLKSMQIQQFFASSITNIMFYNSS